MKYFGIMTKRAWFFQFLISVLDKIIWNYIIKRIKFIWRHCMGESYIDDQKTTLLIKFDELISELYIRFNGAGGTRCQAIGSVISNLIRLRKFCETHYI